MTTRIHRATGLYLLKPWFTRQLAPVVTTAVARGVSPDVFTAVGVLGAAAAWIGLR